MVCSYHLWFLTDTARVKPYRIAAILILMCLWLCGLCHLRVEIKWYNFFHNRRFSSIFWHSWHFWFRQSLNTAEARTEQRMLPSLKMSVEGAGFLIVPYVVTDTLLVAEKKKKKKKLTMLLNSKMGICKPLVRKGIFWSAKLCMLDQAAEQTQQSSPWIRTNKWLLMAFVLCCCFCAF